MNGKINQSPTSDESNSTLQWSADSTKYRQENKTQKCITNSSRTSATEFIFYFYFLFSKRFREKIKEWKIAQRCTGVNACRKFMQVHEPVWKWCSQRDKEHHHVTIPCDVISISMLDRSALTCSNAFLWNVSLHIFALLLKFVQCWKWTLYAISLRCLSRASDNRWI